MYSQEWYHPVPIQTHNPLLVRSTYYRWNRKCCFRKLTCGLSWKSTLDESVVNWCKCTCPFSFLGLKIFSHRSWNDLNHCKQIWSWNIFPTDVAVLYSNTKFILLFMVFNKILQSLYISFLPQSSALMATQPRRHIHLYICVIIRLECWWTASTKAPTFSGSMSG